MVKALFAAHVMVRAVRKQRCYTHDNSRTVPLVRYHYDATNSAESLGLRVYTMGRVLRHTDNRRTQSISCEKNTTSSRNLNWLRYQSVF